MSRRGIAAGLVLAVAAAVLAAALLWIARTTLRLEAAQAEAQRLAAQEERVRLSLWRMDSALTALIGRENALSPEPFGSEAGRLAGSRFEVDLASPAQSAAAHLGLPVGRLVAALGEIPAQGAAPAATEPSISAELPESQMVMNTIEFNQRLEAARQQSSFLSPPPQPRPLRRPPLPDRVETTFQPVWSGDDLYLVRRVRRDGEARMQGIRVDWPGLRASLLGEIDDLLPRADLLAIAGEQTADPGRRLALLPVRLVAGAQPAPAAPTWTPARLTVAAASGAIVLAAVAVAALLVGSIQQGRRRADFVSAVTHELRTPLTTFRMYTEMLAGGMVAPGEQGEYLATLSGEADRLGHLVENVLAYSRLERQPWRVQPEAVGLETLLAEMAGRLGAAAARGGFELAIHPAGDAAGTHILVDRAAVERILLNWIDNACKYAADAEDRRLEIEPRRQRGAVVLRLRDHGPGIPRAEHRQIFRPFHKSARSAAASAPGVGLGLTLSRRLARSLGGDLRLADADGQGAAFDLRLRAAPPG